MFGPDNGMGQSHGVEDFIGETIQAAKKYSIKHELLELHELQKRYPQFHYHGSEYGYYEPDGGYLKPEKCIEAQLK